MDLALSSQPSLSFSLRFFSPLCRNGADIHQTDQDGRTVFHWAMKTPNINCLKWLCKYRKVSSVINKPVRAASIIASVCAEKQLTKDYSDQKGCPCPRGFLSECRTADPSSGRFSHNFFEF